MEVDDADQLHAELLESHEDEDAFGKRRVIAEMFF